MKRTNTRRLKGTLALAVAFNWCIVIEGSLANFLAAQAAPQAKTSDKQTESYRLAYGKTKFELDVPKDYDLMMGQAAMCKTFAWRASPRNDKSVHALLLSFMTVPKGQSLSSSQLLKECLATVKERRLNWSQSDTTEVIINKRKFLKTEWHGIDRTRKVKMTGVVYSLVMGNLGVTLSSQDIDAHAKETIPLSDKTFTSFRI